MKFNLTENLNEDYEVAPGITFEMLMDAALNGDGDFVLNPPEVEGIINLSEKQWDKLYDAMFDTDDDDTIYYGDEYDIEVAKERDFGRRYNCDEVQCKT